MNPRSRRAALYALGAIAILASTNALAHSYAGLYDWAVHHRLSGWQAKSWPAEIDVFLAVGELALYVAYLDGWPARQRIWPWATALIGLAVSIAGNIGHIQAQPGRPVILAERLTAATSPIAAFAGLAIGLLVLKMTRPVEKSRSGTSDTAALVLTARPSVVGLVPPVPVDGGDSAGIDLADVPVAGEGGPQGPDPRLLHVASVICQDAAARGERLSQRALARQLRGHGQRFPNGQLGQIAHSIGLTTSTAA